WSTRWRKLRTMKRVQVLRNLPMPDHSSYADYERVTKIPKSHFQFLIILCFRSFLSYQLWFSLSWPNWYTRRLWSFMFRLSIFLVFLILICGLSSPVNWVGSQSFNIWTYPASSCARKEKKEKKTYQLRLTTNGNVPTSFCRRKRDSELNNVVLKFIR
ncbi:hypothetical protein IGI04_020209, partial [Brassica rapa subsp. trilocularis]